MSFRTIEWRDDAVIMIDQTRLPGEEIYNTYTDFKAVAEIRSQIMQARNRGAAVLLVSEDLDEILELADRILVISAGKIVFETTAAEADRHTIGHHMAGH